MVLWISKTADFNQFLFLFTLQDLLIAYQHISWPVLNFNTFLHAPVHTYSSVKPFFSPIQTQIKTLILLYFQQYNVIPFPPWQYHVHCFFRCDDIQMWPYRHDVFFCCSFLLGIKTSSLRRHPYAFAFKMKRNRVFDTKHGFFLILFDAIYTLFASLWLSLGLLLFLAIDNENQDQI